jgi:Na+/citrate or Na+/malate symporter
MNIVPETIMPYIVKNPNTIIVALCIKTITFINIVDIVGKAMVNRPFSKHSILHGNHLPRNVKLAHTFAKQHTRLFETHKVIFVSK